MPARSTLASAVASSSSRGITAPARPTPWRCRVTRRFAPGGLALPMLVLWSVLAMIGCQPAPPTPGSGRSDATTNGGAASSTGPSGDAQKSDVQKSDASAGPAANEPLRVLVVDDPALGQAIARQWRAHAQQQLTIVNARSTTVDDKTADADVMIFPSAFLGQMVVNRWIVPWPRPWQPAGDRSVATSASGTDEEYRWNDVLPFLRRQELRWGEQQYGVSFGSPLLMLLYRQDLLTAWGLEAPRTWTDYLALLPKIDEKLQAARAAGERGEATGIAGPVPSHATLLPLTPGWAARCLLAWAAPYARHPNQYSTFFQFVTMEPLIARPPFERALQELLEATRYAPEEAWTHSPDDVMRRFLAGDAVLAWSWPSAARNVDPAAEPVSNPAGGANSVADSNAAGKPFSFGIRSLPGSTTVYQVSEARWEDRAVPGEVPLFGVAGRVGAVARRSRSPEASCNLLLWLTGQEQAARVAAKSSFATASRLSQLSNGADQWVDAPLAANATQFAAAMQASQQSPDALMMPRIPGETRYLDALDLAIRQARAGDTPPAAALQQAAQEWTRITEEFGKDAQRKAYTESLGLTAP